ncbi:TRAP transporter substrate-binding protein [Chloroflexota bacterium]
MNKKRLLIPVVVLVCVLTLAIGCAGQAPAPTPTPAPSPAPTTTPAPTFKLNLQPHINFSFEKTLPKFVNRVKQMTDGRVDIELFSPNAIGPGMQTRELCASGALDIGYYCVSYDGGAYPLGTLAWGWPFGLSDKWEIDDFNMNHGGNDILGRQLDEFGVHLLGQHPSYWYGGILSKTPINKLTDVKGMKFRSIGVLGNLITPYGASVVSMPMAEIYTGLQTGVIDAIDFGVTIGYDASFHEVAKYWIEPMKLLAIHHVVINNDTWAKLPDDLKNCLEAAYNEFSQDEWIAYTASDQTAMNNWIAEGVQVSRFSDSDLAEMRKYAIEGFNDQAAKDTYCTEYGNAYKEYMKFLGRPF